MKLRCLIIEDEPPAREIMKTYIHDCPVLELVAECGDAFRASEIMQSEKIDLLFLDINLPRLSGINFLKTLNQSPLVIFTTAYPEYAVEGFESDAVDYLVKPFAFDRFLKAVNKAMEKMVIRRQEPLRITPDKQAFILLRSDKKVYRVSFADILYIESIGDYLKVFLENKHLIIHETISGLSEQLPVNDFIRIHKSFIVAVNRINYIEGNQVKLADKFIPIGRNYRDELLKALKQSPR